MDRMRGHGDHANSLVPVSGASTGWSAWEEWQTGMKYPFFFPFTSIW